MSELLYTVKEVFTEVLEDAKATFYNIPSYQRGYKWTTSEVRQLLEDINKFDATNENSELFYCLQNITLTSSKFIHEADSDTQDSQSCLNVIDGQQRLTTMYIILRCLEREDLVRGKLNYSVRESTKKFLEKDMWDIETSHEAQSMDMHYIIEASNTIKDYIAVMDKDYKQKFEKKILNNVKFIVNTPSGEEEKIFATLNGGKINLDGADLIRAVIMTRSAKEYYGPSNDSEHVVNEKRVRIGLELDEMNLWWGQADVKTFFEQIIPDKIEAEIKGKETFDNSMLPINILYKLFYLTHNEQESVDFGFGFFEYGLDKNNISGDDHWELYEHLRNFHMDMQEWFFNTKIYHYIGYLFFNYKRESSFYELYKKYNEVGNKEYFIDYLAKQILVLFLPVSDEELKTSVGKRNLLDVRREKIADYKNLINEIQHDWYHEKESTYRLLALTDILYLQDGKQRLDVNYFTRLNKGGVETEDKEHIGSQNPTEESLYDKIAWERSISAMDLDDDNKNTLRDKLNNTNNELTEEDVEVLVKELTAIGLNSIGNIVLLHQKVNRGYGNSPFVDKRLAILKNFNGDCVYIRPYTLNAFMKGFQTSGSTDKDNNTWTLEDIRQNAKSIAELVCTWMTKQNK